MRERMRQLKESMARARSKSGGQEICFALRECARHAGAVLLIVVLALPMLPLFGIFKALSCPAAKIAKPPTWIKANAWRIRLKRRWELRLDARQRRSNALASRSARKWARLAGQKLASRDDKIVACARLSLAAKCVSASALRVCVLLMILVIFAPIIAVLFLSWAMSEMGLKSFEDVTLECLDMAMMFMDMTWAPVLEWGPWGAVAQWTAAAPLGLAWLERKRPRMFYKIDDPWSINAFALSARTRRNSKIRSAQSAGRVVGYELWLDPELAVQACNHVGWAGACFSGWDGGLRGPWTIPMVELELYAKKWEWEPSDPRVEWVQWAKALGEARDMGQHLGSMRLGAKAVTSCRRL
jgi:hypothetical protein